MSTKPKSVKAAQPAEKSAKRPPKPKADGAGPGVGKARISGKAGEHVQHLAVLAKKLASIIDEIGFMEAKYTGESRGELGKLILQLGESYRATWRLAGEEMLLSNAGNLEWMFGKVA